MYTKFNDLKHKATPEQLALEQREAKAELERMGFGKLRQARQMTQVALAERLDVPQGAISRMERRTDLLLSTLRQYIEGMGGRLELKAVFPEAEFLLDTLAPEKGAAKGQKASKEKRSARADELVGAK
jgi:transcriptional regulator with XRE-family HTH domain